MIRELIDEIRVLRSLWIFSILGWPRSHNLRSGATIRTKPVGRWPPGSAAFNEAIF